VSKTFDVIILGGGPAGYVCAIRCTQLGLQTAVVERDKLGGVCVNIGCIPSKALLHAARVANIVRHDAKALGIETGDVKLDYGVAMKRSRQVAEQNSKGVEFLMKKNKVTVLSGTGTLQAGRKVKVGNDVYAATKAVVVATGSRVKGLPQAGLDINKTTVLSIEVLPRILPLEDSECSAALARSYKKRKITIMAGAKVTSATVGKHDVSLEVEANGKTTSLKVEKVLMAAGRALNVETVGLEAAGVKLDDRGFIKVDANLQTTADGIYAIGDIAGPPMLAHKGSREGVFVAETIAGAHPHPIRYDNIPSVTYCHPEVASIGLTEDACKERQLDYQVGKFPFTANGRARAANETDGFVKIIRDRQYGEILGAHIVASHASEIIHELVVAREHEYTVEEVDLAVHAHPTLSEAVAEAALDSMGRVLNT
jgi:dihydrolipoamide dehydrogenase